MKLSTRTRYGVRAMLELALNYEKGPIQLQLIADRQEISKKYLEQLITILKAAGFVKSVRGAKGGYELAKPPDAIKLSDCFNSLEGPVITVECIEDEKICARISDCIIRQVWIQVNDAVEHVLASITLQDLVNAAKKKDSLNYQI